MFEVWSRAITESLIQAGIIKEDDQEIYRFGIQQGMTSILNIVTTLAIGVILHAVWQSIVFMIAYIPLRHYAGGYHAKTPFRCYFISIALISSFLLAVKFLIISKNMYFVMLITASAVILHLSPVDATMKPLEPIEKKIYKRRAMIIWFVETILILMSYLFQMDWLASCIVWVLVFLALMLIIEKTRKLVASMRTKDSGRLFIRK